MWHLGILFKDGYDGAGSTAGKDSFEGLFQHG